MLIIKKFKSIQDSCNNIKHFDEVVNVPKL